MKYKSNEIPEEYLQEIRETVESWPKWKQDALGSFSKKRLSTVEQRQIAAKALRNAACDGEISRSTRDWLRWRASAIEDGSIEI